MAQKRVEEVFIGERVISAAAAGVFTDNPTVFNAFSSFNPDYYFGIVNENNELLTAYGAANFSGLNRFRIAAKSKTRNIEYSDWIDRRKITRVDRNLSLHYNPIVYCLYLNGINNAVAGDRIMLTIKLTDEREFCYENTFIQYTFTDIGNHTDVVNIAKMINDTALKKYKGFVPYFAFTGANADNVGITPFGVDIDANLPAPINNYVGNDAIYIIAGNHLSDISNINQYDIYDLDIFMSASYSAVNNQTYENTWSTIIPGASVYKGAIRYTAFSAYTTYNAMNYPTYVGTGPAVFNEQTVATTQNQKAHDSKNLKENIISHYYSTHLGYRGHQNRVIYQDTPEVPYIVNDMFGYASIHIYYEGETRNVGHSPEMSNKPKHVTLYLKLVDLTPTFNTNSLVITSGGVITNTGTLNSNFYNNITSLLIS